MVDKNGKSKPYQCFVIYKPSVDYNTKNKWLIEILDYRYFYLFDKIYFDNFNFNIL